MKRGHFFRIFAGFFVCPLFSPNKYPAAYKFQIAYIGVGIRLETGPNKKNQSKGKTIEADVIGQIDVYYLLFKLMLG